MNKDFYNGKVKKEFINFVTFSIIFFIIVGLGMALFFLLFALLYDNVKNDVRIFFYILSGLCFISVLVFPLLTIYLYRSYPKHPKLTKFFTNSSVLIDFTENK